MSRVPPRLNPLQRNLRRLARLLCRVFYERVEVAGEAHIPHQGAVMLCANHTNAIADAIIILATYPGLARPLARSGLFRMPGMHGLLRAYGAVPVFRRGDPGVDPGRNDQMFEHCHRALADNATLLIFPEGQSHTDPHLNAFKTGAARIVLGARDANGRSPTVLPVGLTFTHKGQFRASVLVNYGAPVPVPAGARSDDPTVVHALTGAIADAVATVTLNTRSWDDLDFLKRVERFINERERNADARSLDQRFRTLRRLVRMERSLRGHHPDVVDELVARLTHFEDMCRSAGFHSRHLELAATPGVVTVFFARVMAVIVLALPLGAWGWLNGVVPFLLTRLGTRWLCRGVDQYDTARMALGAVLFLVFWGAQTYWVDAHFGRWPALFYLLSLPVGGAVALALVKERRLIRENFRALWSLLRGRGDLRQMLLGYRDQIDAQLEQLEIQIKRRWRDSHPRRTRPS